MRSIVMRPGELKLSERDRPIPGPGQVLVRTIACGICGSDLHLYKHAADYRTQALAAGIPEEVLDKGVVLGHEFVAEIVEYGVDTEGSLPLGQRVCSMPFVIHDGARLPIGNSPYVDGAYADYLVLSEALLLPVPDGLSSDAAALVEPLAIGVHAVNQAPAVSERPALVLGCGPIGLAVIAVLQSQGASKIVAADLSQRRRALASDMGASQTLDPRAHSAFAQLLDLGPVNIFDCTGANPVLSNVINEAPALSCIVIAGIVHGEQSFNPEAAITKELSLHFVFVLLRRGVCTRAAPPEDRCYPMAAVDHGQNKFRKKYLRFFAELEDPDKHAKVLIYPHGVES